MVIAGTGAGKSTPFVLPALKNRDVKVLLISPLKALQDDQAACFEALGVSSAAVNGDTWSDELQEVCPVILKGVFKLTFRRRDSRVARSK